MYRLLFTLCLVTAGLSAQELSLPEVTYVTPSDYLDQQAKVTEAIDYLQHSPANVDQELRERAAAFIITWLEGTPTVTVDLGPIVTPFMSYGESLIIFLGGYTKYTLQAGEHPDPLLANLAGTERVIEYYAANRSIFGDHKELDKLVRQEEKGRLRDWVARELKRGS